MDFKVLLVKTEMGSFPSFISICSWGQWDESCPGVLLCLLPIIFPIHFLQLQESYWVGKRTLKLLHFDTQRLLPYCWNLETFYREKDQDRWKASTSDWSNKESFQRPEFIFSFILKQNNFSGLLHIRICLPKGNISNKNDLTLIFWQGILVYFFSLELH